MLDFLDPKFIIQTLGLIGVGGAIFAESGILIGMFLPGDSLLFMAGFFASQGFFHLPTLLVVSFVCAVLGDSVGYFLGKKFGPAIFKQKYFLKKEYIERSENFFAKYGPKTIILSRFVPIVRTIAPIMAGVANMKYKIFLINNFLGAFVWGVGVTLLGYLLGSIIPNADFLTPVIILIVIISILPVVYNFYKARRANIASRDNINSV